MSGMKEANCHLPALTQEVIPVCSVFNPTCGLFGWRVNPLAWGPPVLSGITRLLLTRSCAVSSQSQLRNAMQLHLWRVDVGLLSSFRCSTVENMWEGFAAVVVVVFAAEAPKRSEITREFKQRCQASYDKRWRRGRTLT